MNMGLLKMLTLHMPFLRRLLEVNSSRTWRPEVAIRYSSLIQIKSTAAVTQTRASWALVTPTGIELLNQHS